MAAKKEKEEKKDVTMLTEDDMKDISTEESSDESENEEIFGKSGAESGAEEDAEDASIVEAADQLLGGRSQSEEQQEDAESKTDAGENRSTGFVKADGITVASKRQKRKIYKQEHVVTESGDEELKNDADLRREKWLDMVASYKSGKILKGTIVSCRTIGESTLVVDVVYADLFTVTIPVTELIELSEDEQKDLKSREGIAFIKTRLNHRIGSEVDFVIVNELNEKNRTAFGSRLTAMYKKRYAYYVHRRNGNAPLITSGKLVKANIVSVNGTSLTVEVFGVETTIKQKDISYNRVEAVDDLYDVGNEVVVRVMDVQTEKVKRNIFRGGNQILATVDKISIAASIKDVTEDPRKESYNFFNINGDYLGTVVQSNESGVFVNLCGMMDCLCPLPDRENVPTRGSKVLVHVTLKKDDELKIYGQLKKVIRLA